MILRPPRSTRTVTLFPYTTLFRAARIESLWAGSGAVENGMAPIEPERVLQLVQSLAGRLVAAVGQPAPSLQKHGGTQETVPVPPVNRAAGGEAEAKDDLVVAIEPFAVLPRFQPPPDRSSAERR